MINRNSFLKDEFLNFLSVHFFHLYKLTREVEPNDERWNSMIH